MLDKNGKEMVTGCVVEIKNAYFKTDNGLYFIEKSPEELGWLGSDYCLLKLKRNGQLSTAKKNICFWPIMSFVSDRMKSIEANAWNKEHATIEVRTDIDCRYIKEYFKEEAERLDPMIEHMKYNFGEDHPETIKQIKLRDHRMEVSDSIQ